MDEIKPVKPGYLERAKKDKEKETAITTYDQERMKKNASLGTSGIDPADVMPSEVKLVQGSTDFSRVVDEEGTQAKVGQFFFRGDKSIHESVKGYALSLAKVNDTFNQREDGSFDKMYRMIGVFEDLKTPFTLNFRRGAITTVKTLLSNVFSQKRGIYTFKIEITTEQRSAVKDGKQVNYLLPVIMIIEKISDPKMLNLLERGVFKYEYLVKLTGAEDLMISRTPKPMPETTVEPVDETKKLKEDINPDDIPF